MKDVSGTGNDDVHGGDKGHSDLGGEQSESVADATSYVFSNPDLVSVVGFKDRAGVPGVHGMRRSGGAVALFL
jgi:hypothetical protein